MIVDPEWRSWVRHVSDSRARFLTAGDWPRCEDAFCVSDELGCGRPARAVSPDGVPTCCAWPSRLDRLLLGVPPYEPPPFEPSPICAAVMERAAGPILRSQTCPTCATEMTETTADAPDPTHCGECCDCIYGNCPKCGAFDEYHDDGMLVR